MRGPINQEVLTYAVEALTKSEPRFAQIVDLHGLPALRLAEPGLTSLLRIVTDQLISLKAGEAIWQRIAAELQNFEPKVIYRCGESGLMRLGLTRAKARTFLSLAKSSEDGLFEALGDLDDAEAAVKLMLIPGIGPWTANIYLLTALGRTNAFPAGDLALQVAAQNLLALDRRPNPKQMCELAKGWQPWRSVAARLLWCHYRGLRGIGQPRT